MSRITSSAAAGSRPRRRPIAFQVCPGFVSASSFTVVPSATCVIARYRRGVEHDAPRTRRGRRHAGIRRGRLPAGPHRRGFEREDRRGGRDGGGIGRVAGEHERHQSRGKRGALPDLDERAGRVRRANRLHQHVLALRQRPVAGRQRRRRGQFPAGGFDNLHEVAPVAERLEAPLSKLGRDVGGGYPLVARAAAAPVYGVAGQEHHVAANGRLGDHVRVGAGA